MGILYHDSQVGVYYRSTMKLETIIKTMGFAFRNLVLHSNGQWSCSLGRDYYTGIRGPKEFWGDTPMEAARKAQTAFYGYEALLE